jgi:HAD superfamily hydrolase (TIGR01484 family)
MHYQVLAADYDGTLAEDGLVPDSTVEKLKALKESGRRLVLVSGRRLEPLLELFPALSLFEYVVAENGALLYSPQTEEEELLSNVSTDELFEQMRIRGVNPIEKGRTIVATWTPFESIALETIRDLGLEMQIIFNKDAVMVLPSGCNKASGLAAALDEMEISPLNVVAIGDAENDEAMMRMVGVSVAVDNALDPVKEICDLVMKKPRGAGVEELIEMILQDDLELLRTKVDKCVPLGTKLDGQPLAIPMFGESILVVGGPGGGKSRFAVTFIEQLKNRNAQICIVDPEGDYRDMEHLVYLGTAKQTPAVEEVFDVLEDPNRDCAVGLFSTKNEERPKYFNQLFRALSELRSRTSRPHWIIVDEAHYVAPGAWQPADKWNREELKSMMFVTAYHEEISHAVFETVDWVVSIADDPTEALRQCCHLMQTSLPDFYPPEDNQKHQAIAWRRGDKTPIWFSRFEMESSPQRHRISLWEGEMDETERFVFRGPDEKLHLAAKNLENFIELANGVGDDAWSYHLENKHYSTWFDNIIKDPDLAGEISAIEDQQNVSPKESREEIAARIREKFEPKWASDS